MSSYATRFASIASSSLHALTSAFSVLTCLLLSDVNTSNAFVVDVTLTAFVLHVASIVHVLVSRTLMSSVPLLGDIRSSVADVSTYAVTAVVHAAETRVLFTVPVTATSVLGASVSSYLEDNAYVLCVWNHLWLKGGLT